MGFESFLGWLRGRPAEEPAPPPSPAAAPETSTDLDEAVEALRARTVRRAIRMEIGGFAPPEGPAGSWFGRVNLALPGEEWPTTDGEPLHALAQIDLTQLPFRPALLQDLEMITVFIDPDLDVDRPNGQGWCLRAYPDLTALVPLEQVHTGSEIRAFPMRPEVVEADYPNWEDVADEVDLPEDLADRYYDYFDTAEGFKLGGWPFLVQHSIQWGQAFQPHPARPEFAFQIDSSEKGNWMWGDSGLGYFGRGTRPGHTGEWVLSWQCY
jgi:hypothetical protein